MTSDLPVTQLPGVGETREKALTRLGITQLGHLVSHYPRAYEDRTLRSDIAHAPNDRPLCISALVAEPPRLSRIRKGLELVKVKVVDHTGQMELTFFNQSYVKNSLATGRSFVFYGLAEGTGSYRRMTNPAFEKEGVQKVTGRILPIYPLTAGLSNTVLMTLVQQALSLILPREKDTLPPSLRQSEGLCSRSFALKQIHLPSSMEDLDAARKRLCFEEFFFFSLGLALLRHRRESVPGILLPTPPVADFLSCLPFSPTNAQQRAMAEIAADLASGRPMNRLLQGDVGSGKTAVAAYAGWLTAKGGGQTALMAPTEILAEQHFRTLSSLLAPAGVRVGLLTGGRKLPRKKRCSPPSRRAVWIWWWAPTPSCPGA